MAAKRKRCIRYNEPGHAHSLTFSCYQNKPLLKSDQAKRLLADSLEGARGRHEFDLWAYVFMPEHVHLLLWPRNQEYSISAILKAIKQPMAFRALKAGLAESPRFWQRGGGYDRNIIDVATLYTEVDYVHNNPVRSELCATPQGWKYSSAAFWLGCDDVPLAMDRSLPARR